MGILNVTPDSFYPESRAPEATTAVERGLRMVEEGASILDVGGESTRPGSSPVAPEIEIERVVPVISELRRHTDIPISIDTQKAAVAEAALDAGADIVNDVSALQYDPDLGPLVADRRVPVILMHMRGTPKTMQDAPRYNDVVEEVRAELVRSAAAAESLGIPGSQIVVDPGIGFGKGQRHNLELIRGIPRLADLGYPLLLGVSRKSFIGRILSDGADLRPVEQRLSGTLAVHLFASLFGADILRVHDVRETRDLLRVLSALLDEDGP
jgi:dihydropteroate synthase